MKQIRVDKTLEDVEVVSNFDNQTLSTPIHELLDRYEILYPMYPEITDLRRAVIDKDLSSIFRLCEANEELRKAVVDENLHSIFRLMKQFNDIIPNFEDLRKAVIEENFFSIFRLLGFNEDDELRIAVCSHNMNSVFKFLYSLDSITFNVDDLKNATVNKNISSLFKLFEKYDNSDLSFHIDDLRKAISEKNLYSLFRLFPEDNEEIHVYRTAIVNKNIRSIFKLLKNDDLRKLIVDDNNWKLWPILDRYVDTQFNSAFKNFFINNTKIDKDCFSRGQLESKLWLVQELQRQKIDLGTVFLCAGWYATLATMLFESNIKLDKIRSFDIDPTCASIAEVFNKPWVKEDWRFKACTQDILEIKWDGHSYPVNRSDSSICMLYDTPDTIINTSCEHIENFAEWYENIPQGKLVVLQSNNYFEIDEHVNCVNDIYEFKEMATMSELHYMGERDLTKYKRFMLIGYK